jgi:putative ABC transport system permease protein
MRSGAWSAAFRHLRRNLGFTVVATATLALGLTAATAAFALISAVVLAPLPYPDADRLWVPRLKMAAPGQAAPGPAYFSYPEFATFRRSLDVFDRAAAYLAMKLPLTGAGGPERLTAELVTPDYFNVLGARPQVGRLFVNSRQEAAADAGSLLLSDRLWRRRFGADPGIVGRRVEILRQAFTVAGVLPADFVGLTDDVELWLPIAALPAIADFPEVLTTNEFARLRVVARARPGVAEGAVRGSIARAGRAVAATRADVAWGDADAEPFETWRRDPNLRRILVLLLAAAAAILLIACANVAGLQLSHTTARRQELAIRAALGASPRRVVTQILTESGLLALLGGAAGVATTFALLRLLDLLSPRDVPSWGLSGADLENLFHAGISPSVAFFAIGATLAATLLAGLVPAFAASHGNAVEILRAGGASLTGAPGHGRQLGRRALAISQTAAAVALLAVSGLFLRSLRELLAIDPGFLGRSVLALRVESGALYDAKRAPLFHQRLLDGVVALPGVSSAALGSCVPFDCHWSTTLDSVDGKAMPAALSPVLGAHFVSPGYFHTLRIPLIAGREFTPRDRAGAARVVIVSRSVAARLWPHESAVGHRVRRTGDNEEGQVVGVVGDARQRSLTSPPTGDVYVADYQNGAAWGVLFVRTQQRPAGLVPALRQTLRGVDPDLPFVEAGTLAEQLARASSRGRYATALISAIASVALSLTLLGVYGIVAQAVGLRRRELALRLALGASRRRLLGLVLRQGLLPVLAGLALGLPLAWAACRWLNALVYGASGIAPAIYLGVLVLVVASATLACLLPSRRALDIDPAASLRHE